MKKKICGLLVTAGLLLVTGGPVPAVFAEDTPFVGEMIWVPYNFAPVGWAFCNGQLLPISQYTALFSLLGTQYGGNGTTNFALPDMQGRLLINAGQGPGLSNYVQGQTGGEATHTLTVNEMPAHSHPFQASTTTATGVTPSADFSYGQAASGRLYGPDPSASMAANAVVATGGGAPHNNMMPYTTLNCIISLQGIFPSRP